MATNPWVTTDVTRWPSLRARELRRVWEEHLSDGRLDQVRRPVAESWRRSEVAGVDPSRSRAPTMLTDRRDVRDRWEGHPLVAAVPLIRRWLGPIAAASEHLIVVSDAEGLLLWLDGDARVRSAAADAMNFVEGALWSEAGAGTNAIGTALATDHAVQVHAAEHFSEVVHGWTCSAVPVHNPADGQLLGVIDLTGPMANVAPGSLAAALAAARAVEADLHVRAQVRDAQLHARSGRVTADPDGALRGEWVEVPTGGVVMLPSGRPGFAEPMARSVAEKGEVAAPDDLTEWRRAQLELSQLLDEQAALRRVATLVAGQATAEEIFAAVAKEVARLLRADRGTVCRYEPDGMTVRAFWTSGDRTLPVGTRVELEGASVAALVQQSGRPSRIDSYEGRGV